MKTSERLRDSQILKAVPVCPTCDEPAVFRGDERRVPEDNRYVECINGHVWHLTEVGVSLPPAPGAIDEESLEAINEPCRGATVEEFVAQKDGVVLSFRGGELPDLFIRIRPDERPGLVMEFGE